MACCELVPQVLCCQSACQLPTQLTWPPPQAAHDALQVLDAAYSSRLDAGLLLGARGVILGGGGVGGQACTALHCGPPPAQPNGCNPGPSDALAAASSGGLATLMAAVASGLSPRMALARQSVVRHAVLGQQLLRLLDDHAAAGDCASVARLAPALLRLSECWRNESTTRAIAALAEVRRGCAAARGSSCA